MTLFMGIDGGSSQLRIAIVAPDMRQLALHFRSAANPSNMGHSAARMHIQRSVQDALRHARLPADSISAVAAGIAGASAEHSRAWLLDTLHACLPQSQAIASSDLEIALVGALGQRHGILLLAGTGSAVYGAVAGESLQIGGWGHLLGDEGGGYWLGMELLRYICAQHDDGQDLSRDALCQQALESLELPAARDIVTWLYHMHAPVQRVAALAPLVLAAAAAGHPAARAILEGAADHLERQLRQVQRRLHASELPIAFAGGLLSHDTPLARAMVQRLALPQLPQSKYPPVIGAAYLAQEIWSGR